MTLNSVSGLVSNLSCSANQNVAIKSKNADVPGTLQEQSTSQPITSRAISVSGDADTEFKETTAMLTYISSTTTRGGEYTPWVPPLPPGSQQSLHTIIPAKGVLLTWTPGGRQVRQVATGAKTPQISHNM